MYIYKFQTGALFVDLFTYRPTLTKLHLNAHKLNMERGRYADIPWQNRFLTDRSKAVLLLWIFHAISVLCLLCFRARLFIDALWSPAGKVLTSWLLFVLSYCEFVAFSLVSWVRCGTWLYCYPNEGIQRMHR